MDELQTFFAFNDVPGHLAYAIIAVSYHLTHIFWLSAFCGFFQLYRLAKDRYGLSLSDGDRVLLKKALVGLDDFQITSIMKASSLQDIKSGQQLTVAS